MYMCVYFSGLGQIRVCTAAADAKAGSRDGADGAAEGGVPADGWEYAITTARQDGADRKNGRRPEGKLQICNIDSSGSCCWFLRLLFHQDDQDAYEHLKTVTPYYHVYVYMENFF